MRLFASLAVLVFAGCHCGGGAIPEVPPAVVVPPGAPSVRVLLRRDANLLRVSCDTTLLSSGRTWEAGTELEVRADGGTVVAGGLRAGRIEFSAVADGTLRLDGRRYRGRFVVTAVDGRLRLVNVLPMESYLAGVVGREMSPSFCMEALKAQAIAARTYALDRMRSSKNKDHDITTGQEAQVYGGVDGESDGVRRAVGETAGEVLHYDGKIFPAFYHSTCGGRTSAAWFVFGDDRRVRIPPLRGGVECTYCKESPRYEWTVRLSQRDALKILKKAGHGVSVVKEMTPIKTDGHGRCRAVEFQTEKGLLALPAGKFRAFSPVPVHSTRMTIRKEGDAFVVEGHGWGHGVGMCQWGAQGMAEMGFSAREILGFYYPESRVVRIY